MISLNQRFISSFLYLLPLTDLIWNVNNNIEFIPLIYVFKIITIPILNIQNNLPIGNFWILFLLYIGIAKNINIPYFIRFNTMQMILIKLILLIINYIYILIFSFNLHPLILLIINKISILIMMTMLIFSILQCMRGIEANLPLISQAAKMQI